ncbi:hypothetical protein [Methylobacterium segetis]|uniref:hypothetical protein n=1 Tax=Methylobacterium segetis TaxID=2488750 RepID=UPI001053A5B7|nr:hypothetical protein [Methylobacterium segetis]
MDDSDFLQRAVARGIVSEAQAAALAALRREGGPASSDLADEDERVRFVTGFSDIFVTIGILLVLGTTASLASVRLGPSAGSALVAGLAWGLAELFSRRRRMALPSIVLLAAFVGAAFMAVGSAISLDLRFWSVVTGRTAATEAGMLAQIWAALAAGALAASHYRRFRVPITVAAGVAILVVGAFGLLDAVRPDWGGAGRSGLAAALGLAVFALAMRFDLSDPGRVTRRTDIAFWLHLLAAPLIVHPVLGLIQAGGTGPATASLVLALVWVLALVALVTDRRAILVSGLVYASVALGTLIREAGFANGALPYSLLVLGLFVLALSIAWKDLRRLTLRALPPSLAARLPHPIGAR